MSTILEPDAGEACASFGITAVDDVKLKYVMVAAISCIIAAMVARKIKRSRSLFKQPDSSHMGECPICCLPLSIDAEKSTLMTCCCKIICDGCNYANVKREDEQGLMHRCVYCREPMPASEYEAFKQVMKRIKKNDPVAMTYMGAKNLREGDYGKAFEYWTKAAELGHADARCCSGCLYYDGDGVEKDVRKAIHHWEQAAIGGHPVARGLLAAYEWKNGRFGRAAKHFIINANLGCDTSLQVIKDLSVQGIVSKEDYAAARRGHQAALDATKSDEREKVDALFKDMKEALDG